MPASLAAQPVKPAQNAALSPTATNATVAVDPTRAALSTAAAAAPTTPAGATTNPGGLSPAAQAAADIKRQVSPSQTPEQQAATKAAFNQAYLALSDADKLAVIHDTTAPSSANKLAGVRNSSLIGAKSGNATLSDEQLGRVAVAQNVLASSQPRNDAEARAAFAAAISNPNALQDPAVQAFVQSSTANLSPELAAARTEQQAASQAAIDAEVNRRIAENVAGTNLGNGQFVGGTPGTPVLAGSLPAPAPALPPPPTLSDQALQQGVDVDQRALAALANISQRRAATAAPVGDAARAALDRSRTTAAAQAIRAAAPAPSANKAAGVRNSTVLENRASTPERDAGIIALAASMTPPGQPIPTTLEQARVILAANGI